MRLRLLGLLLVGLSSCARPSLESLEDKGGEPAAEPDDGRQDAEEEVPAPEAEARDSGVQLPTAEDAGGLVAEPDAGCADADGDRVCDAKDNCPNDPNPDQADADKDGTGDACDTVVVNCQGDRLETGEISSSATLARLTINGQSDKVVSVKPGDDVTVSVTLSFSDCNGFALLQLFLGLESETPECQPAPGCTGGVPVPLPYEFTFKAPNTPGLHYLLAGLQSLTATCSRTAAGASNVAAKRVAALCVGN